MDVTWSPNNPQIHLRMTVAIMGKDHWIRRSECNNLSPCHKIGLLHTVGKYDIVEKSVIQSIINGRRERVTFVWNVQKMMKKKKKKKKISPLDTTNDEHLPKNDSHLSLLFFLSPGIHSFPVVTPSNPNEDEPGNILSSLFFSHSSSHELHGEIIVIQMRKLSALLSGLAPKKFGKEHRYKFFLFEWEEFNFQMCDRKERQMLWLRV